MSNKALNHVWNNSTTKGSERVVLLAIADMANDNGDCFPGVGHIAAKANLTSRHTSTILRKLEKNGEIIIVDNSGCKTSSGYTNLYTLVMHDNKEHVDMRRKQAQGVKNISSLDKDLKKKGVKTASGDDMKTASGDDMKTTSGNPLVEPSVNPSYSARRLFEIDFLMRLIDMLVQCKKQRNKDIVSIIEIHLSTGVIDPSAFANRTKRQVAAAILDAGCAVQDVQEYVWSLKGNPDEPEQYPGDDWWHTKSISLQHIAANILAWKTGREQTARVYQLAQQVDDIVEEEAGPTDPKMLEAVRNMMAQMGASS